MARLSLLPIETWPPELKAAVGGSAPSEIELGVTRITAHRPVLSVAMMQYNQVLRSNRTLPERLMELVRLRIAFHNQCRSCMAIRYASAVEDGLDEGAVCSLQKPFEAPDLSEAERSAIDYGERLATNHLSIDEAVYDRLRTFFNEAQIVELGLWAAWCVGLGRLAATWDMVEDLPEAFQDRSQQRIGPWQGEPVVVNRGASSERLDTVGKG
ncbi:MAG: carboxymuconolactone decarboxylase family protein [Phenylobacterium sp.]|uniref:carboxymuconolactone decarboxylase family protein n=1 Tax=Phenylobacterium sp. TaxID=1871053 RepID=UPI0027339AAD|nr:carboxymuconolactone decarboxylase family protein [Phenylobacterium sp.]MDP3747169.1 carboxymuconolactone decarboxylase family protein [Phenylobacterium sp.]